MHNFLLLLNKEFTFISVKCPFIDKNMQDHFYYSPYKYLVSKAKYRYGSYILTISLIINILIEKPGIPRNDYFLNLTVSKFKIVISKQVLKQCKASLLL